MEKYNVILFLALSFCIFKYKAAQETTEKQRSNDARVVGLLVGFFSLLGFIAIFVAIWCYCCHYDNKSKEKLPVRNVSVKPMVLPEHTRPTIPENTRPSLPENTHPNIPTVSKLQAEIETGRAIERDEWQACEIVPPSENKVEVDDKSKDNKIEEDGTQLESYRK